jgi:hypothetical protein
MSYGDERHPQQQVASLRMARDHRNVSRDRCRISVDEATSAIANIYGSIE